MPENIELKAEKPNEKVKEITEHLVQGIQEFMNSEKYKKYLNVMAKFHNYSFNNTMLIAMQKPDATCIAGFSSWKNQFGRHVKKGEKAIKIIAPSAYKTKKEIEKIDPETQKPIIGKNGKPMTEEQEITIPAFRVVSVFDVSQTEGKEMPNIAVDTLKGNVKHYRDFFDALEKTAPVPVSFEKIQGDVHGYYHLKDKRIVIQEGMSELQTLKTAIHEIAYAKLHDIDFTISQNQQNHPDRQTREVEAESIAYTVCQHYRLDTSDYSFGYIAGWSSGRELAELKSSLEIIRSTAAEIINTIDGHFAEIQKAQDKAQEQPAAETPNISITCEWSEHETFEDGKTYSVEEFNKRMEEADREWCWQHKHDELYSKVKFTVHMPDGSKLTERQDIGDGFGGVINFIKSFQGYEYKHIAEQMEKAVSNGKRQMPVTGNSKEKKDSVISRLNRNMEAVKQKDSIKESNHVKKKEAEAAR